MKEKAGDRRAPTAARDRVKPRRMKAKPGIDLNKSRDLADGLEDAEVLRKLCVEKRPRAGHFRQRAFDMGSGLEISNIADALETPDVPSDR